ncbi:MAG: UDP-N-acetylmuramate dehydrogenase [Candidatus Cloacimonetes bacterium]|nr:UDP-N-acetylmuramate dehydrogenase [Candidatus Cloacimonadota bacterium]
MQLHETIKIALPDLYETGIIGFEVPLKEHGSFQIGGPAEVFCTPHNQKQLISIVLFCLQNDVPYFVLGKGSNLLISDKGLRGLVISTAAFTKITRDEDYISAYCGVLLKDLCNFAMDSGLSGLEFASGIPGSVGGAVFMNAGAYGGEIKDVLYCSKCLIPSIESLSSANPILHFKAEEHKFAYRYSALQELSLIHLSSVFHLKAEAPSVIKLKMDDFDAQRQDKQPMDLPSAGSVFKRPEGYFTGKLVDDCGLRGFRIGDAAVSGKHCGFIVNLGSATAEEVIQVIRHVQGKVLSSFGVRLETEIRMLGEF